MADQSTYNFIRRRVEEAGRGALFFPDTFADAGTSDAVRSALVRLCENGILTRVAQGIYCYPRIDERWGGGSILPTVEEITQAIAARDRVRVAPTGAYALYRLGLSTQIPANVVFVTDGSPRRVSVGKGRGILFKHTSEMRTFAYKSSLMALIVTALREIGEEQVTDTQMSVISEQLKNIPAEEFNHDLSLAPLWVRKKLTYL